MGAEELAELVKGLREERGLTQGQLAEYANVKRAWLSHVENAERKRPERERLERLAGVLRVPPESLLKAAGYKIRQAPEPTRSRTPQEVLRELQAITPLLVPETEQPASAGFGIVAAPEYWPYQPEPGERNHRFIAVPVRGSCMEPRLKEGERVIVDMDASPRAGDVVLALHDGEALIKLLERRNGDLYLVALRDRPPLKIGEETRIAGVVKMAMHKP